MIIQIGILAGQILSELDDKNNTMKLTELPSFTDELRDMILMSIGTLVRQGLIFLYDEDGEFIVVSRVVEENTLTVNDQISINEELYENRLVVASAPE